MSTNKLEASFSFKELFRLDQQERPALWWSFVLFFALVCGYYMLRPVREALISGAGIEQVPRMFTAVFIIMLILVPIWGAAVAKIPRNILMPRVFIIVAVVLGLFCLAMKMQLGVEQKYFALGFSIFISVFNLFLVSVFWSFMSDIFNPTQARKYFSVIAAGGTLGGISGALLTSLLAKQVGVANILLVSTLFFGLCILSINRLTPWARQRERDEQRKDGETAIGGSPLAGASLVLTSPFLIGLSLLMLLGVSIGTMLYSTQVELARQHFPDPDLRAAFFANVDLAVNLTVVVAQLTLTRWLYVRFGVAPLLLLPMIAVTLGLATVAMIPIWYAVTATQIVTRGGNFALLQPARESLFTLVDRESRFKAKNFIDTFVYRAGDMMSSWIYLAIKNTGAGISHFAGIWCGVALINIFVVLFILREERKMPRADQLGRVAKK